MKRPVRSLTLAAVAVALAAGFGCSSSSHSSARVSGPVAKDSRASLGAGDALGSALFGPRSGTGARIATARD
ncbi:MAG: hypothetical protein DYG93_10465 [Leptolyngbya sp. PLA2]|nr:hypothetical protein [Leptolyngbya sp. PL-A2]MCQ3940367.1 hypothetical protein [cyanobacterium CYA1]MCZ7633829.1 hypothetical protein [Phycisphaerales bacterium]MDL1904216.1 hypothetical protein [Synechococcales cyanobacterium CNB]